MTTKPEEKKGRKLKCYLCGETFNSLEELAVHDIRIHALRQKNVNAKKKET